MFYLSQSSDQTYAKPAGPSFWSVGANNYSNSSRIRLPEPTLLIITGQFYFQKTPWLLAGSRTLKLISSEGTRSLLSSLHVEELLPHNQRRPLPSSLETFQILTSCSKLVTDHTHTKPTGPSNQSGGAEPNVPKLFFYTF